MSSATEIIKILKSDAAFSISQSLKDLNNCRAMLPELVTALNKSLKTAMKAQKAASKVSFRDEEAEELNDSIVHIDCDFANIMDVIKIMSSGITDASHNSRLLCDVSNLEED